MSALRPIRFHIEDRPMPKQFQLAQQSIIAFVAARDPERARKFYRDTLGLRLVHEELPFALVFDLNGTMLRVTIVENLNPAPFTVLGWQVPDINIAVGGAARSGGGVSTFSRNAAG